MSEFRWDPLKNNWAIIASGESRRPQDFLQPQQENEATACPFCSGNEQKTAAEIYAYRPDMSLPNQPGWQVRVIPNKFPALRIEGELDNQAEGLYDRMNGIGAHEVIIETPDHDQCLGDLPVEHIAEILKAYRARILDLRKDSRFRYIFIFKNYGLEAAARIAHSHSQLIALPLIPPMAAAKLNSSRAHYQTKKRCLICDLIKQERTAKVRIIRDDGNYIVYAPYAARFPFELMIAPLEHCHDFTQQSDQQLLLLAAALRTTLLQLRVVLKRPPYSFILHNAPPMHLRWGCSDYWASFPADHHWHIELVPKLTRVAGFEWGSGFHFNPTPPEEAANFLRHADLSKVC